jgi:hypothetical protein
VSKTQWEGYVIGLALLTVLCIAVVVALWIVLRFCAVVVAQTGDTAGLRDVAVVLRAFSLIGSLRRGRS